MILMELLKEISENSSRLGCRYDTQDPYNEKPEFSKVERWLFQSTIQMIFTKEVSLVQMIGLW